MLEKRIPVTFTASSIPIYALADTGYTQSLISNRWVRHIFNSREWSQVECGRAIVAG